jgi:hypothetical protein
MIWLFHRRGEYMSCEARTCVEDSGFESLINRPGQLRREWYADEQQLMRRWQDVSFMLRREGWGDVYGGRS